MTTYKVGERVTTPLGAGTVVSFEHFDDEGMSLEPSNTDQGRRVVVKLDDPTRWAAHATHGNPYMFRSEIQPI